jgi:hypothetical protein
VEKSGQARPRAPKATQFEAALLSDPNLAGETCHKDKPDDDKAQKEHNGHIGSVAHESVPALILKSERLRRLDGVLDFGREHLVVLRQFVEQLAFNLICCEIADQFTFRNLHTRSISKCTCMSYMVCPPRGTGRGITRTLSR